MIRSLRISLAFLLSCLLIGLAVGCGTTGSKPLVGILQFNSTSSLDLLRTSVIKGLNAAGFLDNVNVTLVQRNALGDIAKARQFLQEFADQGASLVIVSGSQTTEAANDFRNRYSVVFCGVVDPVAAKIAVNLANANPNATGVYNPFSADKGVRLVKEVMPAVTKIGTLYDPSEAFAAGLQTASQAEAARLGVTWVAVPVASAADVVAGVQELQRQGVQALMQLPSNTVNAALDAQIAECQRLNLPIYSIQIDQTEKGVIAAEGIDLGAAGEQAGALAAKVLNGASPNVLPMEKAVKEPLYLNLTAAARFGITVPTATRQRAEKTIGP